MSRRFTIHLTKASRPFTVSGKICVGGSVQLGDILYVANTLWGEYFKPTFSVNNESWAMETHVGRDEVIHVTQKEEDDDLTQRELLDAYIASNIDTRLDAMAWHCTDRFGRRYVHAGKDHLTFGLNLTSLREWARWQQRNQRLRYLTTSVLDRLAQSGELRVSIRSFESLSIQEERQPERLDVETFDRVYERLPDTWQPREDEECFCSYRLSGDPPDEIYQGTAHIIEFPVQRLSRIRSSVCEGRNAHVFHTRCAALALLRSQQTIQEYQCPQCGIRPNGLL